MNCRRCKWLKSTNIVNQGTNKIETKLCCSRDVLKPRIIEQIIYNCEWYKEDEYLQSVEEWLKAHTK